MLQLMKSDTAGDDPVSLGFAQAYERMLYEVADRVNSAKSEIKSIAETT
jgi:hypothetical protein